MLHYQNGRFIEAETLALSITKEFPLHQFSWKILGAVYKHTGRITDSVNFMQKSVQLEPKDAEAHNNLGVTLQELGRLREAEASCAQAIILDIDYIEAHNNLGNILKDQGKLNEAIIAYDKAISINSNYADAHYNMGLTLKLLGKLQEAITSYSRAVESNPNHADAYNNLGNTYRDIDKIHKAIEAYKMAVTVKPDHIDAYNNLGNAYKEIGKSHEAIEVFKKVLLLNPNYALAYNNMGNILKDQGQLEEAIVLFQKAISINPDYSDAYNNIGNALKIKGKSKEAINAFRKALSLKPDDAVTHKNLSFALLNDGRLKEGLDEYEWRWKTKGFLSQIRNFSKPIWDGKKSLKGKRILIWCEQGVGDTINWSLCLPFIASQAEHCILECQKKLVLLLQRSFPNIEVKKENRQFDINRDDFDFHLPMGSLYKYFTEEILSNSKILSHLIPDKDRVVYWKERLKSVGNGPYIGISWKSSNTSPERLLDYTSISEWSPILKIPNITLINMQYKDFADELTKIQYEYGVIVHNFNDIDHFNDIDDVAALSCALDMVISTKLTVPLISAGVGTSTKLANWRQSSSNNVLLNPLSSSVQIYERNTWDPWQKVFNLISKDVLKLKNKTKLH